MTLVQAASANPTPGEEVWVHLCRPKSDARAFVYFYGTERMNGGSVCLCDYGDGMPLEDFLADDWEVVE